jgi:Mn-dependent DtxR family transcriptional regulator
MAGRPPDVTDEDILEVFRASGDPVLFTGVVAEELPIGRDGVRTRLKELHQRGLIGKKQRGNVIVWWRIN